MTCKICLSPSSLFDRATILGKYEISYFRCANCGFIQTEDPYWLDEAYSSAINVTDTGIIARNLRYSRISAAIISAFFNKNDRFLDYAGGYGVFTRCMRDRGFDFYWSDPFCANLVARGFESKNAEKFPLFTAFEVFEHLVDPIPEVKKMLENTSSILFTTELHSKEKPLKSHEWWYYALEHGQHVSLHTTESLKEMATQFKLNFYSDGKAIHLMTDKKINPLLFLLTVKMASRGWLNRFSHMKSKTESDMIALRKSVLGQ
jgi:hypothetical protein